MNRAGLALGSMGLGAVVMYWVDPAGGRRRRAHLADLARHALREAEEGSYVLARDLANRSQGLLARPRTRLRSQHVPDEVLQERVRAALGRVCSHPRALQVQVAGGRVRLRGPILKAEVKPVLRQVRRVPGVRALEEALEVHRTAGNHPSLQGGVPRPGVQPELLQEHWSPTLRLVAVLTGMGVLSGGWRRWGPAGLLVFGGGGLLALRGMTNLPLKRLFGVGAGRRAIRLQKDLFLQAPVEEVYAFWRNMENFPRFMRHVEQVKPTGVEGRTHWRVRGPGGVHFSWEAVVTRVEPGRLLAWKSVEGAVVENAGVVRFEPVAEGGTRLDIHLTYNPPAGALGHAFAHLLGADPKQQLDEDLLRLKALLERGHVPPPQEREHEVRAELTETWPNL